MFSDKEIFKNRKLVDYALMAGFFEGEGSIYVSRSCRNRDWLRMRVSVAQTSKNKNEYHRFLGLYMKYFGGVVRRASKLTKGGKYSFKYSASHKRAMNLLKELLPFLEEKKERAKLAVKMGEINLNFSKNGPRRIEKFKLAGEILGLNK